MNEKLFKKLVLQGICRIIGLCKEIRMCQTNPAYCNFTRENEFTNSVSEYIKEMDKEDEAMLINKFIEDSKLFGFDIELDDGKYWCKAKCNHCGIYFKKVIKISIVNIDREDKVHCDLPVYCVKCER